MVWFGRSLRLRVARRIVSFLCRVCRGVLPDVFENIRSLRLPLKLFDFDVDFDDADRMPSNTKTVLRSMPLCVYEQIYILPINVVCFLLLLLVDCDA